MTDEEWNERVARVEVQMAAAYELLADAHRELADLTVSVRQLARHVVRLRDRVARLEGTRT